MRTRVTELLGIDLPIVQGGMIWNSGWKLARAVSEAGGLGLIGSGSMKPDLLREHVRKAKGNTKKPFGVNIPLIYKYGAEMGRICAEEAVPIVFTSAGSPKKLTPQLRAAGIRVFHVVSTPELAKKCEDAGVDGVVAEGFEAGGHNGRDELATMALVPMTVEAVSIPVLAAGGIATGAQMAAALALGADGVQVGSRFAATIEGSGHEAFKDSVLRAGPTDTVLTLKKHVPVRLIKNRFCREVLEAEAKGAGREELAELLGTGRSRIGMFEGNLDDGELEIGQVSGLIHDLPSAGDVVRRLAADCLETLRRLTTEE
jgi:enoyl-[acyl-carrier protein] reductase II